MNFVTLFKVQNLFICIWNSVYYTVLLDFDIECFFHTPPFTSFLVIVYLSHLFLRSKSMDVDLLLLLFCRVDKRRNKETKIIDEYCDGDRQILICLNNITGDTEARRKLFPSVKCNLWLYVLHFFLLLASSCNLHVYSNSFYRNVVHLTIPYAPLVKRLNRLLQKVYTYISSIDVSLYKKRRRNVSRNHDKCCCYCARQAIPFFSFCWEREKKEQQTNNFRKVWINKRNNKKKRMDNIRWILIYK